MATTKMLTKYDIASIAAINIENGWQRMTAKQQRELFGFAALGRKQFSFDGNGQGTVSVSVSKCFGTDSVTKAFSYEQFAEICNKQEKIEL